MLVVSLVIVGKFLCVGESFRCFCTYLHGAVQSCFSHACLFDVAHVVFVHGRMCCGTYSLIVLAVLCNSIFPCQVLVLVFNVGMCCRHMRSHGQEV